MVVDPGSEVSQRILRTAKDLFFAKGFVSTSLRTIATEAGTSESGVLRIYGSKNGLLRAVYAACWCELNDRIDEAMVVARQADPDPRELILELMRTVWQSYQQHPAMMSFMLSHFSFRETSGLDDAEGVAPEIDERVRNEYQRYLNHAHGLAGLVAAGNPALIKAGVTPAALGHMVTSIIYGIQTSWAVAKQEREPMLPQASVEEALAAARSFLY